jgi:hypothetical protein
VLDVLRLLINEVGTLMIGAKVRDEWKGILLEKR